MPELSLALGSGLAPELTAPGVRYHCSMTNMLAALLVHCLYCLLQLPIVTVKHGIQPIPSSASRKGNFQ